MYSTVAAISTTTTTTGKPIDIVNTETITSITTTTTTTTELVGTETDVSSTTTTTSQMSKSSKNWSVISVTYSSNPADVVPNADASTVSTNGDGDQSVATIDADNGDTSPAQRNKTKHWTVETGNLSGGSTTTTVQIPVDTASSSHGVHMNITFDTATQATSINRGNQTM